MAVNSTIAQARASGGDVAAAIKASRAKVTTPTIAPITGA